MSDYEDDLDETPEGELTRLDLQFDIRVRCPKCGRVNPEAVIAEDLAGAPEPDAEGVYRGNHECNFCAVAEEAFAE